MDGGEDALYRPVLAGVLDPRALDDGSISLYGVMLLNEALDVREENQHRAQRALRAAAEAEQRRRSRR